MTLNLPMGLQKFQRAGLYVSPEDTGRPVGYVFWDLRLGEPAVGVLKVLDLTIHWNKFDCRKGLKPLQVASGRPTKLDLWGSWEPPLLPCCNVQFAKTRL